MGPPPRHAPAGRCHRSWVTSDRWRGWCGPPSAAPPSRPWPASWPTPRATTRWPRSPSSSPPHPPRCRSAGPSVATRAPAWPTCAPWPCPSWPSSWPTPGVARRRLVTTTRAAAAIRAGVGRGPRPARPGAGVGRRGGGAPAHVRPPPGRQRRRAAGHRAHAALGPRPWSTASVTTDRASQGRTDRHDVLALAAAARAGRLARPSTSWGPSCVHLPRRLGRSDLALIEALDARRPVVVRARRHRRRRRRPARCAACWTSSAGDDGPPDGRGARPARRRRSSWPRTPTRRHARPSGSCWPTSRPGATDLDRIAVVSRVDVALPPAPPRAPDSSRPGPPRRAALVPGPEPAGPGAARPARPARPRVPPGRRRPLAAVRAAALAGRAGAGLPLGPCRPSGRRRPGPRRSGRTGWTVVGRSWSSATSSGATPRTPRPSSVTSAAWPRSTRVQALRAGAPRPLLVRQPPDVGRVGAPGAAPSWTSCSAAIARDWPRGRPRRPGQGASRPSMRSASWTRSTSAPDVGRFRRVLADELGRQGRRIGRLGQGIQVGDLETVYGQDLDLVVDRGHGRGLAPAPPSGRPAPARPRAGRRRPGRRARPARPQRRPP